MYNENIKKRFLNTIENSKTRHFYRQVLEKAEITEEQREKDLYGFNSKEQILDFLASLGAITGKSIITMYTPVVKYTQWAIREGYAQPIQYGIVKSITKDELLSLVNVVKFKRRFIESREELHYLTEQFCTNAQDAVIFVLLFNGIDGIKHKEIINLKVEDIDLDNNVIRIKNDGGSFRLVPIPTREMNVIKDAINPNAKYHMNNGMGSESKKPSEINVFETEYVLRKAVRKDTTKVSAITINTRVKKIMEMYGKPFVNPKSVFQSGMICKCKEIEKEKGELTPDDYRVIVERLFNMNPNNWFNLKDLHEQYKKIFAP
ncbi:MAG: hypothetical protein ACOCUI_00275 [bacterium]